MPFATGSDFYSERGFDQPVGWHRAGFFSQLTFYWVEPLLNLGSKKKLKENTAEAFPPSTDSAEVLGKEFWEAYKTSKASLEWGWWLWPKNALFRAIMRTYWKTFIVQFLWVCCESTQRLLSPVALRYWLQWLTGRQQQQEGNPLWEGWLLALALASSGFVYLVIHHQCFWVGMHMGFRIRQQVITAIYDKLLQLNSSTVAEFTTGKVVNLVSNDVRRFDDIGTYWVFLIIGPLELAAVFSMVSAALGVVPALAGISTLMMLIPLQGCLTRYIHHLRHNAARFTDERVRLTSEVLSGALAMKMLGWENPFYEEISKLRRQEVKYSSRMARIRAANMAMEFAIVPLVSFITFAVAHSLNTNLTVSIVFYSLALLHLPKLYIATFFVRGIEVISETVVSIQRIDEFLNLHNPPALRSTPQSDPNSKVDSVAIAFYGSSFDWGAQMKSRTAPVTLPQKISSDCAPPAIGPTLKNICFQVASGEVVAVCGEVGSGKSSLLAALLGELQPMQQQQQQHEGEQQGHDHRPVMSGSVSYCSQVPWVVADTVQANILFGLPFDESLYAAVLDCCALREDLANLPAGDMTELGERGINLSGGQKARVALARAAYSQSSIVLLDDPLSAVDPHVGKHLFDRCIGHTGLMSGSTRLLVTHQRQYLPYCDKVIVLRAGRVAAFGAYAEVAALGFPEVVVTEQDQGGSLQETHEAADNAKHTDFEPTALVEADKTEAAGETTQHLLQTTICEEDKTRMASISHQDPETITVHVDDDDDDVDDGATPFANMGAPNEEAQYAGNGGEAAAPHHSSLHATQEPQQQQQQFEKLDTALDSVQDASSLVDAASKEDGNCLPASSTQQPFDLQSSASTLPRSTSQVWRRNLSMVLRGGATSNAQSQDAEIEGVELPRRPAGVGLRMASRRYLDRLDSCPEAAGRSDVGDQQEGRGVGERPQGMLQKAMHWMKNRGSHESSSGSVSDAGEEQQNQLQMSKSGKLVMAEEKATGSVGLSVYVEYARCIGFVVCGVVGVGLMTGQVAFVGSEYWLATWSKQSKEKQQEAHWVWGYAIFVGAILFISYIRSELFFESSLRGATSLHNGMLRTLLRAPLSFFHTNPSGRILNRFSKDQGIVDELLPQVLFDALQSGFMVLGALVVVGWAVPVVLPTLLPLLLLFYLARKRYICTSREVKRLEAVTRSPVYASFSATLKGLPTIRAYGVQSCFISKFHAQLDTNGSWWFCFIACARWVGTRLDFVAACTLTFTTLLMMVMHNSVPARLAGLALTHTLSLSGVLQWMVRQTAEAENSMTSVERMCEYNTLEQEPPCVADGAPPPPPGWPNTGTIQFDNVTAAYRPGLPPVLHQVTFTIQGGTSCGVVGRTGSGKSSLMLTLFRLIDIRTGCISLDGLDTSSIGLDALRRQLSVIPQDPVLFSGTLRSNLDPWHKYEDHALWAVLEAVQLKEVVRGGGGLGARMSDCGDNFSVGQRQLLCLARALLQDAVVLALDEATANVDRGTDALIQKALRHVTGGDSTTGKRRTLLVIAHRIDTVLDCDSLLLLHHGQLVEQGHPNDLIQQGGQFSRMVLAAKAAGRVG